MMAPDPVRNRIIHDHWWRGPPEMRKPSLAGDGFQSRLSRPATPSNYTNGGFTATAGEA